MATVRKRGNSYQIRVSAGYNTKGEQVVRSKTWKPDPTMTERQIQKEVQKQALQFEDECLRGLAPEAVKFEELAEKWLNEHAELNLRKNTIAKCKQMTKRVYPAIGHLRMDKITPLHIQDFVNDLALNGKNVVT